LVMRTVDHDQFRRRSGARVKPASPEPISTDFSKWRSRATSPVLGVDSGTRSFDSLAGMTRYALRLLRRFDLHLAGDLRPGRQLRGAPGLGLVEWRRRHDIEVLAGGAVLGGLRRRRVDGGLVQRL